MDNKELDRKSKYERAKRILAIKNKNKDDYNRAIKILKEIADYKDSNELIDFCNLKINETRKGYKKIILVGVSVVFGLILCLTPFIAKEIKYGKAIKLESSGLYLDASKLYKDLGDYKDSKRKFSLSYISLAKQLNEDGDFQEAIDYLMEVIDFGEARQLILETYYNLATKNMEEGKFAEAVENYEKSENFVDTSDLIKEAKYQYVINNKYYNDSVTLAYLKSLKSSNYKDSKDIYMSLFAWSGKLEITDYQGNVVDGKLPSSYRVRLTVSGGEPNQKANFIWYYYDKDYNEVSASSYNTDIQLKSGQTSASVSTPTLFDSTYKNRYGYVVYCGYPGKGTEGYKIADVKFYR